VKRFKFFEVSMTHKFLKAWSIEFRVSSLLKVNELVAQRPTFAAIAFLLTLLSTPTHAQFDRLLKKAIDKTKQVAGRQ
jgi:hypothetical protein